MNSLSQLLTQKLDNNENINITFIGDSITSTEWVHPNYREIVEYVLKEELSKKYDWKIPSWNIRTFNCGYDGSTTKDILERLETNILPLRTNILFYQIGGNDSALNIPVEIFRTNVREILEQLKNKTEEIVLLTSPWKLMENLNSKYQPYVEEIKKIAQEYNLNLVNLNDSFKQLDLNNIYTFRTEDNPVEGYQEGDIDPEHPNTLGNAYIAKYILEAFDIQFDPEKYIMEVGKGLKYPQY